MSETLDEIDDYVSDSGVESNGSGYTFNESEFSGMIGDGNQQNNFNISIHKTFEDTSSEHDFPQSESNYSTNFLSHLKKHQQFYHKHHWLIVLRNEDNKMYLYDMLAQLIQSTVYRTYRFQSETIKCRDYINNSDKLNYSKPTITKVIIKDDSQFFDFFNEPENVIELTDRLRKCRNTLIFIVNVKSIVDSAAKLRPPLKPELREYAIWQPMPVELERRSSIKLDEVNIVERCTLVIAIWFNSLPYNLFQLLLTRVLEARVENMKSTAEGNAYPEWWINWQLNPDQYFDKLGLVNSPISDEKNISMHFKQPGEQLFFREQILRVGMFNSLELWEKFKAIFLLNSGQSIPESLWGSFIAPELATYLENLHSNNLLVVDVAFLMKLYQDVRFTKHNNDQQYFLRFVHLVKYLYSKSACREVVVEFLTQMQHLMKNEELQLIESVNNNIKALKSLPSTMAELAELAKLADQDIALRMYWLKDLIYASCILLDKVLDTNDVLFLEKYAYVFNYSSGKREIDSQHLPTNGIYAYFLKGLLVDSVQKILNLSEQLKDLEISKEQLPIFNIARYAVLEAMDSKPAGLTGVRGLNYLYGLLLSERGIDTIIQLLYPKFLRYRDYTMELMYTMTRLRQLLILQEVEDKYLDDAMIKLLQQCAQQVSRNKYSDLTKEYSNLLTDSRLKLISSRNKSEKKKLVAYKNASLFIKKAFKRTGGKTL